MATLITKNSSTASAVPAAGDLVKGELAVNVTDKKVYTKDNSAAVVKLVGSLGNQEANAVAITGGAINGTTIGATTPSTGAFTTASASGGFTGNLTGNVTGNVSGTAANVTGVVAIANGGTGLSALGTGVQSALGQAVTGSGSFVLSTSPSLTTPNLGTPSAAVLTNATGLPLTTGVTGTLGVANGGTGITAFGTGVATALGQNVTGSGGIVLATSPSLTTPNLGTPSAATLTNATGLPISTGVSGLGTGVATALAVNTGSSGAFVVNGGALGTPSSGTVTNLTGTASININGTVGATTPTTGAFTTLSASGNITVSGGTANGVAYLNGSKVLTTGSALTFDGTTFKVAKAGGVFGPSNLVYVDVTSSYGGVTLNSASGQNCFFELYQGGTTKVGEFGIDAANSLVNIGGFGSYNTRFYAAGSEQMRLTSTGLGIGTSSPAYKVDTTVSTNGINGYNAYGANGGASEQIGYRAVNPNSTGIFAGVNGFNYSGGLGSANMALLTSLGNVALVLGTNSTERVRITSAGDVGIGTSSPGSRLNVVGGSVTLSGTASFNSEIFQEASAKRGLIFGYETASQVGIIASHTNGNPSNLAFWTFSGSAWGERMRIDSSGNLGLGVTPSAWNITALQVKNGSMYGAGSTEAGWYSNAYYNSSWKYISNGASAGYVQNGNHQWFVAGSGTAGNTISFTQAMTLDASGNLLVGVTSTTQSHKISGKAGGAWNTQFVSEFATAANNYGLNIAYTAAAPNGTSNQFLYCSDNAVGGTLRAEIRSNGGIANYQGNDVNLSDRREKTNFAPAKSYLDTICAIPVQTFNYIDQSEDDPGLTLGVVAQDVQAVAPELVMESNWGTKDDPKMRLSIYQTDLQYALMKCIQELKAQNDDLRARVAQLEAK